MTDILLILLGKIFMKKRLFLLMLAMLINFTSYASELIPTWQPEAAKKYQNNFGAHSSLIKKDITNLRSHIRAGKSVADFKNTSPAYGIDYLMQHPAQKYNDTGNYRAPCEEALHQHNKNLENRRSVYIRSLGISTVLAGFIGITGYNILKDHPHLSPIYMTVLGSTISALPGIYSVFRHHQCTANLKEWLNKASEIGCSFTQSPALNEQQKKTIKAKLEIYNLKEGNGVFPKQVFPCYRVLTLNDKKFLSNKIEIKESCGWYDADGKKIEQFASHGFTHDSRIVDTTNPYSHPGPTNIQRKCCDVRPLYYLSQEPSAENKYLFSFMLKNKAKGPSQLFYVDKFFPVVFPVTTEDKIIVEPTQFVNTSGTSILSDYENVPQSEKQKEFTSEKQYRYLVTDSPSPANRIVYSFFYPTTQENEFPRLQHIIRIDADRQNVSYQPMHLLDHFNPIEFCVKCNTSREFGRKCIIS